MTETELIEKTIANIKSNIDAKDLLALCGGTLDMKGRTLTCIHCHEKFIHQGRNKDGIHNGYDNVCFKCNSQRTIMPYLLDKHPEAVIRIETARKADEIDDGAHHDSYDNTKAHWVFKYEPELEGWRLIVT